MIVKNNYNECLTNLACSIRKSFALYDKKEIIDSKLFGDGNPNELFNDAIRDYIAIAENYNKCLITDGDDVLASHHAGYTDEEIYVPLIVIDKTI